MRVFNCKTKFLILVVFLCTGTNLVFARRVKEFTTEDKAKDYFDEEATLIPRIIYRVVWGKTKLDEGKIDEAMEYFNEAIELIQPGLYPKNKSYYVIELLAKSYKGRARSYQAQGNLIQANKDYIYAIEIYTQIQQYDEAFNLYQEIAKVNKKALKSSTEVEETKSIAEFFQLSIPFLEKVLREMGVEDKLFIPEMRFYAGLAYRKVGMFTSAGLQFKIAYEETKEIYPNRAVVLALEAGECFIKAKEFGMAYDIHMEVKSLLAIPNLITEETIRKNTILIQVLINFLRERFPRSEEEFIRLLEKLVTSAVH